MEITKEKLREIIREELMLYNMPGCKHVWGNELTYVHPDGTIMERIQQCSKCHVKMFYRP